MIFGNLKILVKTAEKVTKSLKNTLYRVFFMCV